MTARFTLVLLFVSLTPFLQAEDSGLPATVLTVLKAGAPGAKIKQWKSVQLPSKEPGYEIELTDDLNKDAYKAVLDEKGEWVRTQKHYIANHLLPAPIVLLFDRVGPAPNNDVRWSFERSDKGDRYTYKWKTDIRDQLPLGGVRAVYDIKSTGPGMWAGTIDRLQYPLSIEADFELTKKESQVWLKFTKVKHLHSLLNDWKQHEGDGAELK